MYNMNSKCGYDRVARRLVAGVQPIRQMMSYPWRYGVVSIVACVTTGQHYVLACVLDSCCR